MKYGISVPKEEANKMFQLMKKLERNGAFKDFMNPYKPYPDTKLKYPDRQQLLDSINPNMRLTESFFKRIYCYEVTYPGFAEIALQKLEEAGSARSRGYYEQFSRKYRQQEEETLKNVGKWYVKQLKEQQKDAKRKEVIKWEKSVKKMSQSELLSSLENFKSAGL